MAINWKCPYCAHASTITADNISYSVMGFDKGNYTGKFLGVEVRATVCPNQDCKKVTLTASYSTALWNNSTFILRSPFMRAWNLLPSSAALVFPEYVPQAIRDDYEEACKIVDLSPKASATLSRRCIQGMIRDFWSVKRGRLVDEIEQLQDKVDPDTWAAIDAVRKIGNIGAHMEKDINLIIDVEPGEASLLIELIESLIKDWYIVRYQRQQRLANIVAAADSKNNRA